MMPTFLHTYTLQDLANVLSMKYIAGYGHDFTIELTAHKEKLMKEGLTFTDATDVTKELKLILHARVLGSLSFSFIKINFYSKLSFE